MRFRTLGAAIAAATTLVAAAGGVALADDIVNQLDTSIDATAEIMSLNVGGAPKSTTLVVSPTNDDDGKNGCNLTGQTVLQVSVMSDAPTVATVSPSSLTFESCGDTKTITVTPLTAGDATISLQEVLNDSQGTFDLAPATFVARVAGSGNTAPSVAVTGVSTGASYEYGSVPAAGCSATDEEDGPSSPTPSVVADADVVDGIGHYTATCSYTDSGGLEAVSSATYLVVKATSTTTLTCPASVTYDGSAQTPCTASVSGVEPTGAASIIYSPNVDAGTVTVTATYPGDAHNKASEDHGSFTIDKATSSVTVTCPAGPYYFTGSPVTPACTARATGVGGLDTSVTPVTFTNNTLVGTATAWASWPGDANHLGNSGSTTFGILAWTLKGFYQPVDMNGVLNTVKAGSTVPFKFEVFAGSTELTSTSSVKSFTTKTISCGDVTTSLTDDIELTTTGGTSLRYDSTAGQFVQNWQTPKSAGTCYQVTMTTQDGSSLSALFKLK